MKKRGYPLYEACEFFDHCTGEKGGKRKDCGDCELHPRSARIFTPAFILQLLLQLLICFICGALLAFLQKG